MVDLPSASRLLRDERLELVVALLNPHIVSKMASARLACAHLPPNAVPVRSETDVQERRRILATLVKTRHLDAAEKLVSLLTPLDESMSAKEKRIAFAHAERMAGDLAALYMRALTCSFEDLEFIDGNDPPSSSSESPGSSDSSDTSEDEDTKASADVDSNDENCLTPGAAASAAGRSHDVRIATEERHTREREREHADRREERRKDAQRAAGCNKKQVRSKGRGVAREVREQMPEGSSDDGEQCSSLDQLCDHVGRKVQRALRSAVRHVVQSELEAVNLAGSSHVASALLSCGEEPSKTPRALSIESGPQVLDASVEQDDHQEPSDGGGHHAVPDRHVSDSDDNAPHVSGHKRAAENDDEDDASNKRTRPNAGAGPGTANAQPGARVGAAANVEPCAGEESGAVEELAGEKLSCATGEESSSGVELSVSAARASAGASVNEGARAGARV